MSLQPIIIQTFRVASTDIDVIRELESICNIYSLTPEKLKMKWEAFALTSQCDLRPTLPYIKILRNSLQREFERGLKSRRTVKGKVTTKRGGTFDFSEYGLDNVKKEESLDDFMAGMFEAPVQQTRPMAAKVRPPPSSSLSSTGNQLGDRSSSHVVETQFNGHLPLPTKDTSMDDVHSPFTFAYTQGPVKPYRFMFEKIKEKSEGIDERIDYIASLIQTHHDIEAFANPSKRSQEAIYAYGLVSSDDGSELRLNEKSVVLQTSRDLGMGKRVLLDMSRVESYSFFPGQVIGVKGINHNGIRFHVDEVLMPPVPERDQYEIKENKTIDMIVSAGPYTFDSDLLFSPLQELLTKCSEEKPDVLILMGPFISVHHPFISSANIQQLPEHIFYEQVVTRLESLLNMCRDTHVFLVPHANDIIQHYNLFPQPAFNATLNIKHERIHLASNPCGLLINGHTIGIANVDSLFRLGKAEITKNPVQTDKFSRLTEHLLQQHTYYPLYPHALEDNIDAGCLLDIHLPTKPDILILPSQFKHFVKQMNGTVSMNPGFLCKHEVAGTYGRVILYPNTEERVRVDLLKL
ncbi:hypothetical protein MFLAVUS_004743 [Mucor flavus]|uniref:DNA polymerase alpha subunit B n=1 Tax=Mucor flavus TaxID=439312 RepID=A0ABP9YWX1_9FUNG